MISTFLNQPFPSREDSKGYWKVTFGVSLFIFLFLGVFKPFGLQYAPTFEVWKFSAAFGVASLIGFLLYEIVTSTIFRLDRHSPTWTLWKWILDVLCLLSTIAIFNFFGGVLVGATPLSTRGFFSILTNTFLLGLFPTFFVGTVTVLRYKNKYSSIAETIKVDLLSSAKKVSTPHVVEGINVDNILYIQSLQNYVRVHYVEDSEVKSKVIRSTMINLQNSLEDTGIQRCHRSYLVNTTKVISVSGNAQGLKLSLEGLEDGFVPVSRSYVSGFSMKNVKT